MTIQGVVPLAVLTVALVSACSTETRSSGAPPLVVCGATLWSGAAGAVMTDATGAHTNVTEQTAGGVVLRLAAGCQQGVEYSIEPTVAAAVVKVADAHDGKPAAVVLSPRAASFDVHVTHPDGSAGLVQVRLDGNFVPSS